MAVAELWRRPWALVDLTRRHRDVLTAEDVEVDVAHRAALWLYTTEDEEVLVDGRPDTTEPISGFSPFDSKRSLRLIPLPLRTVPGTVVSANGHSVRILWPSAPERPSANVDPQTTKEVEARQLMLRAKAVWDRLRDVDTVLADPARFWQELRRLWTEQGQDVPPSMDIIVHHASKLSRTLDELDRTPRHILKRTHQAIPISRVQELDRRAMTWLVRQPGETLAERAGDRQRILAVAREENYDTLENRVLRSYAELAERVSKDYLERNRSKRQTSRAKKIEEFGRRCRRLARDLTARGVRPAEPGVTPNFVLQQNPRYHSVWEAWLQLQNHNKILDDLWRWQARSWEEFCTMAVMVALVGVRGARLIAAAPINFLEEQNRGSWIANDNPLAAFYLPDERIVVEVRYRMNNPSQALSDFAAPIWVRFGRTGDLTGFLANVPIWPIWDVRGGTPPEEAAELGEVLKLGARANIVGGVVLRPTEFDGGLDVQRTEKVLAATIGTEGESLWNGIDALTKFLTSMIPDSGP